MIYNFANQLLLGEEYERKADTYLSKLYAGAIAIDKVSMSEQRLGIDRRIAVNGRILTIEYKTDFLAHITSNIYVETVSNDVSNKDGWAYTCQSDVLLYMIANADVGYLVLPGKIREELDVWRRNYKEVTVKNHTYQGYGILVPIPVFAAIGKTLDMSGL